MTPTLASSDCCSRIAQPRQSVGLPQRMPKGFTLFEIMLVMAIIAMASLIIFPNLTGLESRAFSTRVQEAQTLLNHARRTAVVSGQPSIASFLMDSDVLEQSPGVSSFSAGIWEAAGIELTFEDSAERQTEILDLLEVTFFPEGGSTGGSLVLSAQSRQASIDINPFNGRVATKYSDGQ